MRSIFSSYSSVLACSTFLSQYSMSPTTIRRTLVLRLLRSKFLKSGSWRRSSRVQPSLSKTSQAFWYSTFWSGALTWSCCQAMYSCTASSRKPEISRRWIDLLSAGDDPRWDVWEDSAGCTVIVIGIEGMLAVKAVVFSLRLSIDLSAQSYNSWRTWGGTSSWDLRVLLSSTHSRSVPVASVLIL